MNSVLLIVDAEAIESVPPAIDSGCVDVRLLIVSVKPTEWTTFALVLIVTSSAEPGTLCVSQFAGVSQLLSPPPPVQKTAESSVLPSMHSTQGRQDLDRDRLPVRRNPEWYWRIAIASFVERPIRRNSAMDEGLSAWDRSCLVHSREPGTSGPQPPHPEPSPGNATPAARIY